MSRVEGGKPYKTMDTLLRTQVPESIITVHCDRDALDPGLFALLVVGDVDLEALPLAVPLVHAEEHLRPVLAFGSTRTRVDGENQVVRVVLAAEGVPELGLFDALLPGEDRGLELGLDLFPAGQPLLENRDIALLARDPADEFQALLDLLALSLDLLGVALIVPEPGLGDLAVHHRQVGGQFRFVKDSRGRPQPSP